MHAHRVIIIYSGERLRFGCTDEVCGGSCNGKRESSTHPSCQNIKHDSSQNKAGYTANTSRGRVGRGGNACFSTF